MTTPLLRLDAPPYEVEALREVVQIMLRETPDEFDALFGPALQTRVWVPLPPERAHVLKSFGLVDTNGSASRGQLPIRRRGQRAYVMALGGVGEYRQDVWPETDALLAKLDGLAPCRVLDMGTGCGIVGIEAAALGHSVVATDLYANTLALAKFNAAMNGVEGVDWRQGHLFDPVAGETFDLVLTAPHYTLVADQLRVEALRAAAPLSTPTGRVVVATFCEWTDANDTELALARTVFADHARAGFDVTVTPMPQPFKQNWFTVPDADPDLRGLPSRHRFLVEITRGEGRVDVTMPEDSALPRTRYRHLQALGLDAGAAPRKMVRSHMLSVIDDAKDFAQLEQLIARVRSGLVTLDGDLPASIHDACRWGTRTCVPLPPEEILRGAVGAQLDREGTVRPCTHGGAVATTTMPFEGLLDTYRARATETQSRRGCETCTARSVCSKCLFPHVVDEATYCATIREWATALPAFKRMTEMLYVLQTARAPITFKLKRTVPLVAARGRAYERGAASEAFERAIERLAEIWKRTTTALVLDGAGQYSLFWWDANGRMNARGVHPRIAAFGELVADGATGGELLEYLRGDGFDLDEMPAVFDVFTTLYTPS